MFPLTFAASDVLVNLSVFRLSNLIGLFICIGGGVFALCKKADESTALLEASQLECRRVYEDADNAMKIKDQF